MDVSKPAHASFVFNLISLRVAESLFYIMKRFCLILAAFVALAAFAQNSGLGFNYQAVVRNADGVLLANANVNLRISLYPGKLASSPTWVETHVAPTDVSGCFGLNVGSGQREAESAVEKFADIDFSTSHYWIKIEVKEGDNYREISYSQLPSSPYSEVAYNATLTFPAGIIIPFAGPAENIPIGWLLCDGSAISRADYSNLYNAIGVCWGAGDGSTTFNIPDLRGMFLRGVSGDSGNDPDADSRITMNDNGGNTGNFVGSYQGDATRNISGSFRTFDRKVPEASGVFFNDGTRWSAGVESGGADSWGVITSFDASRVVPVGSDNRPKNVYVTYIIKI